MLDVYEEEKTPLLIEFTKTEEEGLTQMSAIGTLDRGKLEEKSNKAMEKALTVIQEVSQRVNSEVTKMEGKPNHIEVQFGIKFDAEIGIILAKASAGANLNVSLTWDLKP